MQFQDDLLPTGGSRFAGVDVADNDHVDVHLLFTVLKSMVSSRPVYKSHGGWGCGMV